MKKIIYFAILSLFMMACNNETETATETLSEIKTTEAATENIISPINQNIECFGIIDVPPSSIHEVYAKTNGYMVELNILEGEHINQGAILAEIESPEFAKLQKEFKVAKATYEWQKLNFERNQLLYNQKAISDKDFQTIEKDFLLAKSNYFGLKEELTAIGFNPEQFLLANSSKLTIRSKTHGTVVKINVKNGSKVSPDTHLFTILDKSHLHVEMRISASNFSEVKLEQPFFIVQENDTIHGFIYLINDMIEDDNTVKVHGHFADEEDETKMVVGQKVFVQISKSN